MLFWTFLCSAGFVSLKTISRVGRFSCVRPRHHRYGCRGQRWFADSNGFVLNTTDTGAEGDSGFADSNGFALNTTDTGAEGDSGYADSNSFSLNTTDTGAEGESGFADSNGFALPPTQVVKVTPDF